MLSSINRRLIEFAKAKAKPVRCNGCGETFKPIADQEIASWADMVGATTCPRCGAQVELLGARASDRGDHLAPDEPLPQPPGSRIERHEISASEFLYHIPATGKSGFLLFFAILWNGFLLFFLAIMFFAPASGANSANRLPLALFLIPFFAVGAGMGYAALRAKYASHLLFLGPEMIRLQRQLFGRRTNRDLPTTEVTGAGQKVFYTQNYKPVYGVEIAAGRRKIRFGSALAEDDKRWLCAEVRGYLRQTGNPCFSKRGSRKAALEESSSSSGAVNIQSTADAPPLRSAVVESLGHDSLIIQIPPSGRWGAWLPVALILSFTIPAGCFFLFSDATQGFDN
ncbi:MAG: zinc ribbon domain-containing protein, partial [Chthoniobacteraceae bacterium]